MTSTLSTSKLRPSFLSAAELKSLELERRADEILAADKAVSTQSNAAAVVAAAADDLLLNAELTEQDAETLTVKVEECSPQNIEALSDERQIGGGELILSSSNEYRSARRRRKADAIADAKLSPHNRERLEAELQYLDQAIKSPESMKGRDADIARAAHIMRLLSRSKIAETIASRAAMSKRSAERAVRTGGQLWANILQVAVNARVAPEAAFAFLAHLSPIMQLAVAGVAQRECILWEVEEEFDKYKRAPRLSEGILRKLPVRVLCSDDARARLCIMASAEQKREVARLIAVEQDAERKSFARDRASDARTAALRTDAGSRIVDQYLAGTAADRAHAREVLGLEVRQ